MPPFLMLIMIAFAVLMVMFGNNPIDQWRADVEKYGRDPLARDINKYNEEQAKKGGPKKYVPPPGATIYKLPPNQAQIPANNPYRMGGEEEQLVRPAPDVPMSQWDSPYASYMLAPSNNPLAVQPDNRVVYPQGGSPVGSTLGGTKQP